jgi:serine/threonine-protein kinase
MLDELGRVPEALCRHVGRETAKGLAAIHGAGAVHRDMKPENVIVTPDNVVKVMDLGVARLKDEALRLSQTGTFVGSVLYAAPEQFLEGDEALDGRADLYALGLTLYGSPPDGIRSPPTTSAS